MVTKIFFKSSLYDTQMYNVLLYNVLNILLHIFSVWKYLIISELSLRKFFKSRRNIFSLIVEIWCKILKRTLFLEAVTRRCSVKKVFLKISQNSQENTSARFSLLKKRLWQTCFPVNFVKFLRTPFFCRTLRWLLLLFVNLKLCPYQHHCQSGPEDPVAHDQF